MVGRSLIFIGSLAVLLGAGSRIFALPLNDQHADRVPAVPDTVIGCSLWNLLNPWGSTPPGSDVQGLLVSIPDGRKDCWISSGERDHGSKSSVDDPRAHAGFLYDFLTADYPAPLGARTTNNNSPPTPSPDFALLKGREEAGCAPVSYLLEQQALVVPSPYTLSLFRPPRG
jgi:hypothetical protein